MDSNENSNIYNEIISYDKLVDCEIKTNIITLQGNSTINPKEKSGIITLNLENHTSSIINSTKNIDLNCNEAIHNSIKVNIDESVIYHLNYKLKSAVNQIELIKNYN